MKIQHICKCGDEFETKEQLRIHIALLTPRWPAQRCTEEHYNPLNPEDREYVARYVPDNRDRRFK